MTIHFNYTLQHALQEIDYTSENHVFVVHGQEQEWNKAEYDTFIQKYAAAKWGIVDLLNEKYNAILQNKFDLYNWAMHNEHDEVSYFLSEAGSNCMNYAEFKAPYQFHLWLGSKGFIIGIEQKGKGFNAKEIHEKSIKENEGAAFEFFRKCHSSVFFDDALKTRVVYMEVKF